MCVRVTQQHTHAKLVTFSVVKTLSEPGHLVCAVEKYVAENSHILLNSSTLVSFSKNNSFTA